MKKIEKIISIISVFTLLIITQNCDSSDTQILEPTQTVLQATTNLDIQDIGDEGNGTDLQVSFTKVTDESNVAEYRIYIVNSAESTNFDLATAETISTENQFVVEKTGANISVNLDANSKTTTGELISNDASYKIFIMTVSNNLQRYLNTLSVSSAEITLVDNSESTPLQAITNLDIQDVGNEGNGIDLQVSFTKVTDESNVAEYRIYVVNSTESANFDLATAEAVSTENQFVVDKTGANISVNLNANSKTTTGELISNDVLYKVFVMTVSNNELQYTNTLSNASEEFSLQNNAKVKVTYIANDGVMIEFEDKKVMIDGMNRQGNLGNDWISPSNAEYLNVENGVAPYDDIDVIMVTHKHGDHLNTIAIQNYLTNHPNTQLIVPSSMQSNFAAYASQMPNFSINKFERVNLSVNNISIDVLEIEHFDQNNQDFSTVQSYAYIITLNNKKFFHTGDIDYIDSQLNVFNLLPENISVIFIPTFVIPGIPNQNLVTTQNRDAILNNVNPDTIICMHFLRSTLSQSLADVSNVYPNALTFTTPFQTVEY